MVVGGGGGSGGGGRRDGALASFMGSQPSPSASIVVNNIYLFGPRVT